MYYTIYKTIKFSLFLSLFMFFVNNKSRLIRDIHHREEILAEQELWSDLTSRTKL